MKKVFICGNCNNRIEDTNYCPYCGAKFIQEKIIEEQEEDNKNNKLSYKCPDCNKKIKEESLYCPYCGKNLQKKHNNDYILYYVLSIPIIFINFLVISMECFSIGSDSKCIEKQEIDLTIFFIRLVIWFFIPIITKRKK